MPRTILPLLLASAVGLSAAGIATAAPASDAETTTVRVRVADVDLSSEAGARVALRRITRAAGTICGDEADSRDLQRRALFQACVRGVVDETVASAHSPALAAAAGVPAPASTLAAAN
ncbi:MAG TPA: UrcA family protein [Phenylobacterium sp.]|uniref:UrcA family protein n=1 Tax=Phenylobacterium sp. TaxID=1871053 RepID=UPI002B4A094B|nr:UrcA family protein [Phenylobacterium sp.]HKR88653.1 UrcA family protein [Phenylobacterium sp.]